MPSKPDSMKQSSRRGQATWPPSSGDGTPSPAALTLLVAMLWEVSGAVDCKYASGERLACKLLGVLCTVSYELTIAEGQNFVCSCAIAYLACDRACILTGPQGAPRIHLMCARRCPGRHGPMGGRRRPPQRRRGRAGGVRGAHEPGEPRGREAGHRDAAPPGVATLRVIAAEAVLWPKPSAGYENFD